MNSEPEICELDRAYHHEAGHAVIALKYEKIGFEVADITVKEDEYVTRYGPLNTDFSKVTNKEVNNGMRVCMMAGPASEAKFIGSDLSILRGAANDLTTVLAVTFRLDITEKLEGQGTNDIIYFTDKAEQMVSDHWDEITRVAKAVKDNGGYLDKKGILKAINNS